MQNISDVVEKAKLDFPNDSFSIAKYLFQWLCKETVVSDYSSAIEELAAGQSLLLPHSSSEADVPITIFILAVQIGRFTYASAYHRLCCLAGIKSKTVCGPLRGVGLRQGSTATAPLNPRKQSITTALMATAHSWTILKISEHRQILVCCQCAVQRAAPMDNMPTDDETDEIAVVDNFYFATNPEHFAYSHFPNDSNTQRHETLHLLDTPYSLHDFYESPLVTSGLFALGLDLSDRSKRSCFLVTDEEEIVLELEWKNEEVARRACNNRDFRYLFVVTEPPSRHHQQVEDDHRKSNLNDYCLFEMSACRLSFRFRFPENGFYRVVIFASGQKTDTVKPQQAKKTTSFLVPQATSLVPLCEWLFEVDRPTMKSPHVIFPKCQVAQYWGLSRCIDNRFGVLNSSGHGARLFADENGVAEIYLQLTKPCIFLAKLKRNDEVNPVGTSIFHRVIKNIAVFTIFIPLEDEPTEFGLELLANDPERDGKTLYGFAQFLIVGPAASAGEDDDYAGMQLLSFPAFTSNILGAHSSCAEYDIKALSHPDPLIAVNSGKELEVRFSIPDGLKLRVLPSLSLCKLCVGSSQIQTIDYSFHTLYQTLDSKTIAIMCRFPIKGVYKLQIYAAPVGATIDLPLFYSYAIFVNESMNSCLPFPRQLAAWNGGYLIEPRNGIIPSERKVKGESNVTFKVKLPKALKVAVVVKAQPRDRVTPLTWMQGDQDSDCWWECQLPAASVARSEVSIMAHFGTEKDPSSYSTLLIYNHQEMLQ